VSEEELPVSADLVSRYALLAGLIFVGLKLMATVVQVLLARGDYRRYPDTALFRRIYIAGKVTPALAAASLCVSAIFEHNPERSWIYGLLAVSSSLLAVFVVRLRKEGRFFGVLDLFASKDRDRA
jgi:hypothetical protein